MCKALVKKHSGPLKPLNMWKVENILWEGQTFFAKDLIQFYLAKLSPLQILFCTQSKIALSIIFAVAVTKKCKKAGDVKSGSLYYL